MSAAARMARPYRERLRNSASATKSTGVSATIATYADDTSNPSRLKLGKNAGLGKVAPVALFWLISSASTDRNVARPSVTTMPMTRGASDSRRISPASVSAATAAAATSPTGNAIQYGTPTLPASTPTTAAPNTPIAPWAKLMNRLAR